MKDGKYFKRKEIDLSKISILSLTQYGKLKFKLYFAKVIKILLVLSLFFGIAFIIWGVHSAKLDKRKKVCDALVSSLLWEEKEALRLKEISKQEAFAKKSGIRGGKGREYLDFSPYSITRKDTVIARRSIPECRDVYIDGLDND